MSTETPSSAFIDVAALADIPSGRGLPVRFGAHSIALFKVGEGVHAIENECPHAGSALAGGRLSGCLVRCPSHGLPFDVRDGCMPGNRDLRVKVYAVRVAEGRVSVSVDPSESLGQ
jgi:3-phenylpropionate/trans-cinnamate dioxygenase ferredoxin subunit